MVQQTVNGVPVAVVTDLNDSSYDAVVLVTSPLTPPVQLLEDFIVAAQQLDEALFKVPAVLPCPRVSGGRLVVSPTGPIGPYDDVRSVGEAAAAGVARALAAGARRPTLAVRPHDVSGDSDLVLLLGAFEALYVPLQTRELYPERAARLQALGVYAEGLKRPIEALLKNAIALEAGRALARDIGGGDPERMTPHATLAAVSAAFAGGPVRVRGEGGAALRGYPLLAAVDRCAATVDRHKGCIIYLEYDPPSGETHTETVMLVGKGVTYDTGGADIKTGGAMAGMSRDKCGAAAVAGFFKVCELLRSNIRAVGALAMVRNSVGAEAYVADELLVSRGGRTVRVGNTDAEGRMAMGDLLHEMHERAAAERSPHIYTVATLTGHAVRACGEGYSVAMDNHAARAKRHAQALQAAGAPLGDMVEVSTIRREDLAAHRGRGGDDVLQALSQPSVAVPRGHQGPAGFLLLVSGLDSGPVPYSHLDIAGSGGSLPAPPTGAPILALANLHKLIRY